MAQPRARVRAGARSQGTRSEGMDAVDWRARPSKVPADSRAGAGATPSRSSSASRHAPPPSGVSPQTHTAKRSSAEGGTGMRRRDFRARLGAPTDVMQLLASPSRGLDSALATQDGKRCAYLSMSEPRSDLAPHACHGAASL